MIQLDRRVQACRRRFLEFVPDGFRDEAYVDSERWYKWEAHRRWHTALGNGRLGELVAAGRFDEVARTAVNIESRTNLLFSFEKMALRDTVSQPGGAEAFAHGLHDWLDGAGSKRERFERWIDVVDALPRRQTRVLTWPIVTVFGFIARPRVHIYVKPTVMKVAAEAYGFDLGYTSRPSWPMYARVLELARRVRADTADLGPRDIIDIPSFLWVQGSAEYD